MDAVLYRSEDVRKAIIGLFEDKTKKRIAISAFVGEGAEAYLPHPKNLHIYCWPKEGGTDPGVLRRLIKRGAKVWFVDSLHMKTYWSKGGGAIITSANLSTNALGSGNLKEIGVRLSAGELDINRVVQSLKARPASAKELQRLDRLDKRYRSRNKSQVRRPAPVQSYGEWYNSPFRQQWKLGILTGYVKLASRARRKSREEYGVEPKDWISSGCSDYKKDDWVLTMWLKAKQPTEVEWTSVDYCVKVPRSDRAYSLENPCQYVQIWPRTRYPPPPFRIDKHFRNALSNAIQEFGSSRFRNLGVSIPPKRLVSSIYEHWRRLGQ